MVTNIATTYSAIKSFYDSGHDILGVFANLVLFSFRDNTETSKSISEIKDKFKSSLSIDIPLDVLQTILKRLKRDNLVSYESFNSVCLTTSGKDKIVYIEEHYNTALREKNALISDLRKYIYEKENIDLSNDAISTAFDNFIEIGFSYIFLNERDATNKDRNSNFVYHFFLKCRDSDPENFERLKSVLYGKIISNTLLKKEYENKGRIKNLTIYLDTNIIFSLLGFHEEIHNKATKEAIDMIKQSGCDLKVFSFTKDEIVHKLEGYIKEYNFYSSKIPVDSIYFHLKRKGFSKEKIISFIEEIELELEKYNISIDYSFSVEELTFNEEEKISKLGTYKKDSFIETLKNDISAILGIYKIRGGKKYSLEKSKAVFMTADKSLSLYDFEEHEHKKSITTPEVILRGDMVSLFWLRGESNSDNVFLSNFFSFYTKESFITKKTWNSFISTLKEKIKSGDISEDDIEKIISHNETENILRNKEESGIDEILNNLDKIKEESTEKNNRLNESQKLSESYIQKIKKINNNIELKSKKIAKFIANLIIIVIFVFSFCVIYYYLKHLSLGKFLEVISITTSALFIGGFFLSLLIRKEFSFLNFFINKIRNLENCLTKFFIIFLKSSFELDEE